MEKMEVPGLRCWRWSGWDAAWNRCGDDVAECACSGRERNPRPLIETVSSSMHNRKTAVVLVKEWVRCRCDFESFVEATKGFMDDDGSRRGVMGWSSIMSSLEDSAADDKRLGTGRWEKESFEQGTEVCTDAHCFRTAWRIGGWHDASK